MKALRWTSLIIILASSSVFPSIFAQRPETEEKYFLLTNAQLRSLRSAVITALATTVLQDDLLKRRLLKEYKKAKNKKKDQGHVDGFFDICMNADGFVEYVVTVEGMNNQALEKEIVKPRIDDSEAWVFEFPIMVVLFH